MEPQSPAPVASNQQPAPAPAPVKTKSHAYIIWLVLWLSALPASIAISLSARLLLGNSAPDGLMLVVNILTILLGLYAFVGWVPFVIVAAKRGKS